MDKSGRHAKVSYINKTNVRGDSDVDVVVRWEYRPPRSHVSRAVFMEAPEYAWNDFRDEVLSALISWFGRRQIEVHDKCLKVLPGSTSRAPADVVPAFTYRLDPARSHRDDGIAFRTGEGRLVINYPKLHIRNGSTKNARTGERFKPTVRMLKNMTSQLVEKGLFDRDLAPSYYVESLLWNVPDSEFRGTALGARFLRVCGYLAAQNRASFVCIDGVRPLFGRGADSWNQTSATTWLKEIVGLWERW